LFHFLGPWQAFTVGSYGDCGWDAVDVGLTLIFGWDSNIGNLPLRRRTQSWALAHGDSIRRIIGPCPTWVITAPVVIKLDDDEVNDDDCLINYEYSGTWPQWLDSLLTPGRWLDYPALMCIAEAFDIAVFVVSVVDGDLNTYHLGDLERQDARVIFLTLMHGHWWYIGRKVVEGVHCYCPNWWFDIRPKPDTLLGGMLRSRRAIVDASTVALQLVGGTDDAVDDDEVGRDEFSEGFVSK
jgi:hypothetical protein